MKQKSNVDRTREMIEEQLNEQSDRTPWEVFQDVLDQNRSQLRGIEDPAEFLDVVYGEMAIDLNGEMADAFPEEDDSIRSVLVGQGFR